MRLVVDTSALFSMENLPPDVEVHVTPGIVAELRKYKDRRLAYWEHALQVSEPSKESVEEVTRRAEETGDSRRLSQTDIDIIALARDLGAKILTDDYSIQNLARFMGVDYGTVGLKGIGKVLKWKLRCTGCGRVWEVEHRECPVCGSPLRSTRARK